jgi:hypothetical protein
MCLVGGDPGEEEGEEAGEQDGHFEGAGVGFVGFSE